MTKKQCSEDGCETPQKYSSGGIKGKCRKHGGTPRCIVCKQFPKQKENTFCVSCDPKKVNREKMKEKIIKNFLIQNNINFKEQHKIDFSCVDNNLTYCYIDFIILKQNTIICLEVDEEQHKQYNDSISCDSSRTAKIIESLRLEQNNMNIIIIRYNPDEFKVDGKKYTISDNERHLILLNTINNDYSNNYTGICYLFYDTIDNTPIITNSSDYSNDLRKMVFDYKNPSIFLKERIIIEKTKDVELKNQKSNIKVKKDNSIEWLNDNGYKYKNQLKINNRIVYNFICKCGLEKNIQINDFKRRGCVECRKKGLEKTKFEPIIKQDKRNPNDPTRCAKHNRWLYNCRECGTGTAFCDNHPDVLKKSCRECGGSSLCEHNHQKNKCKECGGVLYESGNITSRLKALFLGKKTAPTYYDIIGCPTKDSLFEFKNEMEKKYRDLIDGGKFSVTFDKPRSAFSTDKDFYNKQNIILSLKPKRGAATG